jgi:M6 family metalloprotease-like protein
MNRVPVKGNAASVSSITDLTRSFLVVYSLLLQRRPPTDPSQILSPAISINNLKELDMRKLFVILLTVTVTLILFTPFHLYSFVPPKKQGVKIPAKMLNRLQQDPLAYFPRRALIKTMERYRESRKGDFPGEIKIIEGTRYLPVICGKYADAGADEWPVTQLQQELFDGPWPTRTMKEFYAENSYVQFSLDGTVYGWYQTSKNGSFYEGDDNGDTYTGFFLKEVFDLADRDIDFTQYDNDGPDGIPNSGDDDGYVDTIVIVHSGVGGEYGGPEIWSHSYSYSYYVIFYPDIYEGVIDGPYVTNDLGFNGENIKIDDYTIQPAVVPEDDGGGMTEISVFCHEYGHALGLPDLYDYGYNSFGVGNWCLMGFGGDDYTTPSHLSAYCKEKLGWIIPTVVTENLPNKMIFNVENNPVVFKLWSRGDPGKEYFLIENRQKIGFDAKLPGSGLLIWHVDNKMIFFGNEIERHKLVDLEEADGRNDLDHFYIGNRCDQGDPYPGSTSNHIFNSRSKPNSNAYNRRNTNVEVKIIGDSTDPMTVDLKVNP